MYRSAVIEIGVRFGSDSNAVPDAANIRRHSLSPVAQFRLKLACEKKLLSASNMFSNRALIVANSSRFQVPSKRSMSRSVDRKAGVALGLVIHSRSRSLSNGVFKIAFVAHTVAE